MKEAVFPALPLIWLAFWLLRNKDGGLGKLRPRVDPGQAAGDLSPMLLLRGVLAIPFLVVALLLYAEPSPGLALAAGALHLPVFPSFWLRRVLIPSGRVRLVYYYCAFLKPLPWRFDTRAGAVLDGLSAMARRPRRLSLGLQVEEDRQLAEDLHFLSGRLGPGLSALRLVAEGHLAWAGGDRHRAERLWRIVDNSPWVPSFNLPRDISRRALVAVAASEGRWDDVVALGIGRKVLTPWSFLFARIVQRILGRPGPRLEGPSLVSGWLGSPFRAETWPLLKRALATPLRTEPPPAPERPEGTPLFVAMSLHRRLLARAPERLPVAAFLDTCEAWDRVRADGAVEAQLRRRAAGLGVRSDPDLLVETFWEEVEEDLQAVVLAMPEVPTALGGPTWQGARARAWKAAAEGVYEGARAVRSRLATAKHLPGIEELLEWDAARVSWEAALRFAGPGDRKALFQDTWGAFCNWAVALHNERKENLVAWLVYTWLRDEAAAVGDVGAHGLLANNAIAAC